LLALLCSWAGSQSLWLETGLNYFETESNVYAQTFKLTLRGTYPLTDSLSVFSALQLQNDFDSNTTEALTLDAGAWFPMPVEVSDPFGLQSYLAVGASYVDATLGLALVIAASYELTRNLDIVLVYTHRPLVYPRRAQAFDVGIGIKFDLE
jgi:hypothetical protein